MGRSRMRALPSRRKRPSPSAAAAAKKRMLVPDSRSSSSASRAGSGPPAPTTVTSVPRASTRAPSLSSACTITSESSATRAPRSVLTPSASAATTSARLVRLLLPGTARAPRAATWGPTLTVGGRRIILPKIHRPPGAPGAGARSGTLPSVSNPAPLQKIVDEFRAAPKQLRLPLLLEYANRLPPLPAGMDSDLERVHECQTPLFLKTTLEDGRVRLFFDAPPEA